MAVGSIIGFDIGDEICQVSYYSERKQEPKTLEVAADNYQIPLMLNLCNEKWSFGREAKKMFTLGRGHTVADLWNKAYAQEKVKLGDTEYESIWLLSKCISLITKGLQPIEKLAFTLQNVDDDARNVLRRLGVSLGVKKDSVIIQDYKESFCHYMFYQPKELWQYETALFYCDRNKVSAYMLRQLKPQNQRATNTFVTVGKVAEAQMEELASVYPVLNVDKARYADERFKKFIEGVFEKKLISSVFLTGEGFENNWYPNSQRVLCNGRRAFMGNNMYSKGACYAAYRKALDTEDNMIYLDETKMTEQISLKMRVNGQVTWYPLVSWGARWSESDREWDVLLEDDSDIEIHVESLVTGKLQVYPVSLLGVPKRKNYSVRLRIQTLFIQEKLCLITFKDIGFGEFFPPSGFETNIELQLGGNNGQLNSLL